MSHAPRPRDRWLLPVLESFLPPGALTAVCAAARDSYWDAAVRVGVCSDAELIELVGDRLRVRPADLAAPPSPEARDLVPEALARRYRVLPLAATATTIDVATSDPGDLDAERALAFAAGRRVRFRLAAPSAIAARLDELYREGSAVELALAEVGERQEAALLGAVPNDPASQAAAEQAGTRPVIRLVDLLIAEGIAARASDVHLEPEEGGVAVRYRVDGVLRPIRVLPQAVGLPLVSRIKIMAGMDIADRLRPQDGRARVAVDGVGIDLRVSTLPAANGEKVVVRILDRRATLLSLDALGLPAPDSARLAALLDVREGMVLVTGPTGSGKTTTLYSALRRTLERGVNVVTVEDPVEYRLTGAVQVQTNEKAGLTFASALRSILRQDPDVVLVGEVRDAETAGIAVQAALTGHLVLSTLHTNDAAGAVTRLLDIGVEGVKLAGALKGVVAQRLLRRVCPACRVPQPTPSTGALAGWLPPGAAAYESRGCDECAMTGYRGRMAIAEVLVVTPAVAAAIAAGESAGHIGAIAERGGMRSLWAAAVDRVAAGDTTADEVTRVLGASPAAAPASHAGNDAAAEAAGLAVQLAAADGGVPVPAALARLRSVLTGAGYAVAEPAAPEEPRDPRAGAAGPGPGAIIVRQPGRPYAAGGADVPADMAAGAADAPPGGLRGRRPERSLPADEAADRLGRGGASGLRAWAAASRARGLGQSRGGGAQESRATPPAPPARAHPPPNENP